MPVMNIREVRMTMRQFRMGMAMGVSERRVDGFLPGVFVLMMQAIYLARIMCMRMRVRERIVVMFVVVVFMPVQYQACAHE